MFTPGNNNWLYVYENHFDLDRAGIERYFGEHERGPLRELPSDPEIVPGLDMLFGHMAYINAGPVAKFWYVYWQYFWTCAVNYMLLAPLGVHAKTSTLTLTLTFHPELTLTMRSMP